MTTPIEIIWTGREDLEKVLGVMVRPATRIKIRERSVRAGGRALTRAVRSIAPRGATGNLIKGIRDRPKRGRVREATIRELRSSAPHSHLVERGTRDRRTPTRAQAMAIKTAGGVVLRRSAAPMPAKPFFDRGIQSGASRALHAMIRQADADMVRVYRTGKI